MNEARIIKLKNIANNIRIGIIDNKGKNMKKVIAILLLPITLLFVLILSSCSFDSKYYEETANQLRQDYFVTYGHELSSEHLDMWCCGTYRGNIAFYPWGALCSDALTTVDVAGIKYTYPDGRQILIYSDGEFYTMPIAYDNNLIGYFDIYIIFLKHELNLMAARK